MGNSCKGTLTTPGENTTFVDATPIQTQISDEAGTTSDPHRLDKYSINVIRVEARPSSLEADSANTGADSISCVSNMLENGLSQDQLAVRTDKMRRNSNNGIVPSGVISPHYLEETILQTQNNPNKPGATTHLINDSRNADSNGIQVVPNALVQVETDVDNSMSPKFVASISSSILSNEVKKEVVDELSLRSHSFESIETLSLESVEPPERIPDASKSFHADVCDSDVSQKTEISQSSLQCSDNYVETELKNISSFCQKNKHEEVSTHESLTDFFTDENQSIYPLRSSLNSDEEPRALVNLLRSLYYGKSNKYRGWSSFRGKARAQGRSVQYKSNQYQDEVFFMSGKADNDIARLNPHGLGSSVRQNNFSPASSRAVFKLEEENDAAETGIQAGVTPDEGRSMKKEFEDNNFAANLTLESQKDKLWLSEVSVPVHKFPFNIYKGRNQTALQSSFPLADFRFDDGIFTDEATPPSHRSLNEKKKSNLNVEEQERHDKSLPSALSIAGRHVKGLSMSETTLSKAHTAGSGLNFRAGASLNDVFLNVTSSSGDTYRRESIDSHNMQWKRLWEQNTTGNSCMRSNVRDLTSDQQNTIEYNRQNESVELPQDMFAPFESRQQNLQEIDIIKRPFLADHDVGEIKDRCIIGIKSGIHNSLVLGKDSLAPSSSNISMEHSRYPLSAPVSPLMATIRAHNTIYSSSVPKHWRRIYEADSVHSHQNKDGRLYLSNLTFEKDKNCANSTILGQLNRPNNSTSWHMSDPSFSKSFRRYFQNKHGLKVPDLDKNSSGAVVATRANTPPCIANTFPKNHTLLARQVNKTNDCPNRLIYSRHMNK
ncbi:hypothetical protein RRG08_023146 [Elysia crispata]|uniref:Uncharacterized protein n=1 Tax=Elysia crispata TaxID=231223 RepID=A0AAE0XMK5_9GAST|nr:hypothetical protein RRG08_023146 [Elysia crispata]